ncbi:MAG TPA: SAF domain-containing protein, partial [Gemmatimonadaceae bacterium]|nr:SAF domain-containing protein [Gemmatimonadaceae bacterium]
VVIQRRCLRATRDLKSGEILAATDLEALRPAPADSIRPFEIDRVVGRKIHRDIPQGDYPKWTDVG